MLYKVPNKSLIKDVPKTYLTASIAAAGTTMTVASNASISNGDYLIIGEIGEEGSEIKAVNGAVTAGTSITITAVTYAHGVDTPVYNADFNRLQVYRATTESGTKTLLNASATEIDPSEHYTYYEDTSNTTGWGFVRWYNSTDSTASSYSGGVNYTRTSDKSSYDRRCLYRMTQRVRKLLAESPEISSVTDDEIRDALNTKQEDVAHARHWSFYEAERSDSAVANQFKYTTPTTLSKVQHVFFDTQPLQPISNYRWKYLHWDSDSSSADPSHVKIFGSDTFFYPRPSSAAASTAINDATPAAADTTITVDSTSGFARGDFYRFKIESEVIYATASTSTTFTGCLRGQEGTTAAAHNDNDTVTELDIVWQGQLSPTDLFLSSDRTEIPEPQVIETGAAMEIAYGTLKDNALGDRMKLLHDEKFKELESKFSMKEYGQFPRIKTRGEILSDGATHIDPNLYPKSINP